MVPEPFEGFDPFKGIDHFQAIDPFEGFELFEGFVLFEGFEPFEGVCVLVRPILVLYSRMILPMQISRHKTLWPSWNGSRGLNFASFQTCCQIIGMDGAT